jgi:hypothetical protein
MTERIWRWLRLSQNGTGIDQSRNLNSEHESYQRPGPNDGARVHKNTNTRTIGQCSATEGILLEYPPFLPAIYPRSRVEDTGLRARLTRDRLLLHTAKQVQIEEMGTWLGSSRCGFRRRRELMLPHGPWERKTFLT